MEESVKTRQNPHPNEFPLEKTTLNFEINGTVLRVWKLLCHRPAVRFGLARDTRGRLRDPQFVSFVAQSNRKLLNTDFHDAVLRGRRWARHTLMALVVFGFAWIVLESAQALSLF